MTDSLRFAWRSLRSRPGHASLTMAILALGIGAATAVYTVAHAVLFAPLPYAAPARVVFLWDSTKEQSLINLTPGRLVDFRERARTLNQIAGIGHLSFTLTRGGDLPERLPAASVSGNFFDVLGVSPARGRAFTATDRERRQVVLTDALWRRRFGADPALVGSTIVLDREPYTVSGVLAADFYWTSITPSPGPGPHPEMFVMAPANDLPAMHVAASDLRRNRRTGYLRGVARLSDGATIADARSELKTISGQLAREFPETDEGRTAVVISARAQLLGAVEQPVALLLAAAVLLLAASCANVANLQLMRFSERTHEFVVQAALGADLRRLASQLVAESATITAGAGILGVLAAAGVLALVERLVPVAIPRLAGAAIDWRTAAVACGLAAASAAAIVCIPILRMRRGSLPGLRERASTMRVSSRTRRVLVAAEIATAVVLLCGAIMFGQSFARLQRVDIGIRDVDRLLTFNLALDAARRTGPAEQRVAFYEEVLRRVRAIPGVQDASSAATLPIGGDHFGAAAMVEGQASAEPHPVGYQVVGTGWFRTLGVPIVAGRDVSPADTGAHGAVVMVNEAFANQHWPGQDPIGRRIRLDPDGPWLTVVGVAGNLRHLGPRQPPRAEVYEPQYQRSFTFSVFAVRTAREALSIVEQIRREVMSVDRGQPISGVATMGEHLRRAQAEMRSLWSLTTLFGGLALVIAALGVYGAIGFTVAQRMREFGVRLALGASPPQVAAHVLRETLATAALGVACGIVLTGGGARVLRTLLFETGPTDVLSYVITAVVLTTVAALAGAVPAARAMRADPASVLRSE